MAKEVNIVVLCDEIYQGLKAKGCGMSPVEALEKTDLSTDKSFNGTFVNIVFDALEKASKCFLASLIFYLIFTIIS